MDMSGSSSSSSMNSTTTDAACKISMLWNWYTVDACFLSSTWHIRSNGMFAGSVIGVFLLVIAIEAVRRLGREYDRRLIKAALDSQAASGDGLDKGICVSPKFQPSWLQQVLRSLVYGSQFTAAFLVMLLGMYYNGYILFAIFIGHTVGFIAFARDTCVLAGQTNASGNCC